MATSHFGTLGDRNSKHPAIILKRTMMDGSVRVYEDSTGGAERTDIIVPEGKVVVHKDYELLVTLAQFKKIVVLSKDDEVKGSIDVIARDRTSPKPVYRFFYNRSEIGGGYGDIGMFLAHKLLGGVMDARTGVGTTVDDEVISTIKEILQSKV